MNESTAVTGVLFFVLALSACWAACAGADWELKAEEIRENAKVKPTRLGINLTAPVMKATIMMRIEPE